MKIPPTQPPTGRMLHFQRRSPIGQPPKGPELLEDAREFRRELEAALNEHGLSLANAKLLKNWPEGYTI